MVLCFNFKFHHCWYLRKQLTLYPATLVYCLLVPGFFFFGLLHKVLFLPPKCVCFLFPFLIGLANLLVWCWNKRWEGTYLPCFFFFFFPLSDLKRFKFHTVKYVISYRIFEILKNQCEEIPSIYSLLRLFYHESMLDFIKCFSASIDISM